MQTVKTMVFWLVIMASAFVLWQVVRTGGTTPHTPEISYSRFVSQVADGQISKVTITCNLVQGYDIKGGSFLVVAPPNQAAMLETLQQHGVEIWFRDSTNWPNWVLYLVPLILLVVLWIVMMRQIRRIGRLESAAKGQSGSVSSR